MRVCLGLPAAVAMLTVVSAAGATNVLTQHNDSARTGANLGEKVLTTSNVRKGTFGKLFTRPVDGDVYAQPLVADGLVIVATMHNTVYAYDVDATITEPVWKRSLERPMTLPDPTIFASYSDIATEIGIVSTPVIDPTRRLVYVVTATRDGNGPGATYGHWLHALDLLTGEEKLSGPRKIAAVVSGSGEGSSEGSLPFQSRYQLQRASLLLASDTLYVAFAAYGDHGPYHGWLLRYDASTLGLRAIFNTTPDGNQAGIWQGGQGPAADASGNVFVVAGNGTSSAQNGGTGYGCAAIALTPQLVVRDWFIPHDFQELNNADLDPGSTGTLLVPDTNLLVTAGKSGRMYVLDRDMLGHFQDADDSQVVQSIEVSARGRVYGSPVYWRGGANAHVYIQPEGEPLKAFRVVDGRLNGPVAIGSLQLATGMPGGVLSVSADQDKVGTGIVWANVSRGENANNKIVPGVLRAYDAADIGRELWNSTMDERDALGMLGKFAPPTIADGRVYVATFSRELAVYGLLRDDATSPDGGTTPDAGTPPVAVDAGPAARPPVPTSAPVARTFGAGGSSCGTSGTAGGTGVALPLALIGGALAVSVLRRRRDRQA